jgi:hypothetical protein
VVIRWSRFDEYNHVVRIYFWPPEGYSYSANKFAPTGLPKQPQGPFPIPE